MADEIVSPQVALGGALVLCAGFGTRLRPLTEERPKALLPVGDRSVLATICDALAARGLTHLTVNSHHLSSELSIYIAGLQLDIQVSHEREILGTAGGIAHARRFFGQGPVLVWNGDILCEPPAAVLTSMACVVATGSGLGACLLYEPRPVGQGNLGIGAESQGLVRLRGERFGEETGGGDYVGISVLSAECVAQLPERGCLVGDVFLPWLRSGRRLGAQALVCGWQETGGLHSYASANAAWLRARGLSEWRGPGAVVEAGVGVRGSIVGAGAQVSGTGTLDGCVVWPGARAVAPLSDAIVTLRTVVPVVP